MIAPVTSHFDSQTIYWLDAFCGAGGASTGIERVPGNVVAVGINHDIRAIEAHKANHPNTVHLNDDIRKVKIQEVADILHGMGIKRINLWWSAECTHLSNAKGGASRDADSRMLSEDMFRYIDGLNRLGISVDMVLVENVKEFFSWTALVPKCLAGKKRLLQQERQYVRDQISLMEAVVNSHDAEAAVIRDRIDTMAVEFLESGRYVADKGKLLMIPHAESKGSMYLKWVRHMEDRGYVYDHRMLNAADFGAYQSRDRYFGVFVRASLGITPAFPKPTHAKNPGKGNMFEVPLEKWRACREILDLQDKGESILYGRIGKAPLVAATLARIKFGINKFPQEADMIDRTHTGAAPTTTGEPLPAVRASYANGLVNVAHSPFIANQYGSNGHNQCSSVNGPTWAVTTSNHQGLCNPLLVNNYGKSPVPGTPENPMGAVTTKPKSALCFPFIVPQFGMSKATSADDPLGALTTNPKHSLNSVMLCKYYGTGDNAFPVTDPIGTIPTKDRFCLVDTRFVQYYYGGGAGNSDQRVQGLETPLNVLGTHHTPGVINAEFVAYKQASGTPQGETRSIGLDVPLNTVKTCFTPNLIQSEFIQTSNGGGDLTRRVKGIEQPTPTVMASPNVSVCQAVLTATAKDWRIHIGLNPAGNKWCPAWMRIEGDYLVDNRIVDIHYRMLKVSELKLAQGFPADYKLDPKSETIAKKHIGNAVHVDAARALVSANCGPDSPYNKALQKSFQKVKRTFGGRTEAA